MENHTREQTVNGQKRAFLGAIYIYIDSTAIDLKALLWYHMGVKLGCFVAVLHEFDLVLPYRPRTRGSRKGNSREENEEIAVSKRKNSAYPAELFAVSALSWIAVPPQHRVRSLPRG